MLRGLKEFGEPTRKALIMDLAPEDRKAAMFGLYYLIRDVVVRSPRSAVLPLDDRPRGQPADRVRLRRARHRLVHPAAGRAGWGAARAFALAPLTWEETLFLA